MAVAATGLAFIVHTLISPIPAMTAAVALGLLAANIPGTAAWAAGRARPGLDFAGKHHMRAGIVLLGLKVSVVDVLDLGGFALVLIAAVVLLSFAGTYGLARLLKLPRDGAMGLTPERFGAWTGASVHDVGQVVATAQTAGPAAVGLAVVVKLTRVILLAPVVAVRPHATMVHGAEVAQRHRGERRRQVPTDRSPFRPWIHRHGSCPFTGLAQPGRSGGRGRNPGHTASSALFGLGSAVRIRTLLHTGVRAVLVALGSWLLIALLGLGAAGLMIR